MINEHELRQTIRHLHNLLVEVDALKTRIGGQDFTPKYGASSSGLKAPGNIQAISTHAHIMKEMSKWATTLNVPPMPGAPLCERIALNAYFIAAHPDAAFFMDDVRKWVRLCADMVGRGPSLEEIARKERRQTARSISIHLKACRHNVSEDVVRRWAERGKISREKLPNQKWGYLLTECLHICSER